MIALERVRILFTYNCINGELRWAVRKARRLQIGSLIVGRIVTIDYENYKPHRLCWAHFYGRWPTKEIDHIDGNPRNNAINNLREATRKENSANVKIHRDNVLGVKGVTTNKKGFSARVKGKRLGTYTTIEEAKAVYDKAAKEEFGEFFRSR